MADVALVAPTEAEMQSLMRIFAMGSHRLFPTLGLESAAAQLAVHEPHVIVIYVPTVQTTVVRGLERLGRMFPSTLILVVFAKIEDWNVPKNISFFSLAQGLENIDPIIERWMLQKALTAVRQSPRKKHRGYVELVDPFGRKFMASILDASEGGLRLVVRAGGIMTQGLSLNLKFDLPVGERGARVAWQKTTGGIFDTIVGGPSQTIGVQFT